MAYRLPLTHWRMKDLPPLPLNLHRQSDMRNSELLPPAPTMSSDVNEFSCLPRPSLYLELPADSSEPTSTRPRGHWGIDSFQPLPSQPPDNIVIILINESNRSPRNVFLPTCHFNKASPVPRTGAFNSPKNYLRRAAKALSHVDRQATAHQSQAELKSSLTTPSKMPHLPLKPKKKAKVRFRSPLQSFRRARQRSS